jgi:hypothetical protein
MGALVLALTRSYYLGDTTGYSAQIVDLIGHPWNPASPMWDAAHYLWRPFGFLLYSVLNPLLPAGQRPALHVAECLIAISALCAWINGLLFYSIALRLGVSRWAACALGSAFLCFNSFLNYAHAGHSYVPGVMCLSLAVRLLLSSEASSATPSARAARWAGVALAASALLWLPYVLSFPAVVLLAAWWSPDASLWPSPNRLRFALQVCAWTIVTLCAVFLTAVIGDRLFSPAAVVGWLSATKHGNVPSPSLFRTLLGLGRSFVYMEDGIQFKRFLLHDPYAGVTLRTLIGTSLSKLVAIYLLFLGAAAGLVRSPRGRVALAVALAAMIPNVLAANFLFESGDTERYLFMLPFVCMCVALVVASPGTTRSLAGIMTAALLAIVIWNLSAMWLSVIHKKEEILEQRALLLRPYWRSGSTLGVLNYQDGLITFDETFPFNPLNRDPLHLFDIIEPSSARVPTWRQEFATQALAAWAQSGDVWVTKRILASRPQPAWSWAEGLQGSVPWTDFPTFFSRFELAQDIGGEDGFVRLAPSQANREALWAIGILPNHPAARFLLTSARP